MRLARRPRLYIAIGLVLVALILTGDLLLRPSGVPTVKTIAAAVGGLALKSDGTVWTWGFNAQGQLGNGSDMNSSVPIRVSGLDEVIAVGAAASHNLAVKRDGTVWAWGANELGYLGNNTTTMCGRFPCSPTPLEVPGLSGAVAATGGEQHSLALRNDGTVWAWGLNGVGQLGNGTTTNNSLAPVEVMGLSGVIAIAAGDSWSLALKKDGTVWAWGSNANGELGIGTICDISSQKNCDSKIPVQVSGLSGVVAIAAGGGLSLALKSDGTVWAWGSNLSGGLAQGNNSGLQICVIVNPCSPVPVQVKGL